MHNGLLSMHNGLVSTAESEAEVQQAAAAVLSAGRHFKQLTHYAENLSAWFGEPFGYESLWLVNSTETKFEGEVCHPAFPRGGNLVPGPADARSFS